MYILRNNFFSSNELVLISIMAIKYFISILKYTYSFLLINQVNENINYHIQIRII